MYNVDIRLDNNNLYRKEVSDEKGVDRLVNDLLTSGYKLSLTDVEGFEHFPAHRISSIKVYKPK